MADNVVRARTARRRMLRRLRSIPSGFTCTFSDADGLATFRAREFGRRPWLRRAGRYALFDAGFLGAAAGPAMTEGTGPADLVRPVRTKQGLLAAFVEARMTAAVSAPPAA